MYKNWFSAFFPFHITLEAFSYFNSVHICCDHFNEYFRYSLLSYIGSPFLEKLKNNVAKLEEKVNT